MKFALPTIVSLFCLLCSCSSTDSSLGKGALSTLRINIGEDPSTLDPRKSRSLCDRTLMNMLYEGLTRTNREEKVEPALAQVIEVSSDLMTYTFYLRNAKWTNGLPIKASDFAYAWKKILDPKFPSDNASQLYPIKNAKLVKQGTLALSDLGLEIIDDQTLKVTLEQPTPYFLELTSFPAFFPVCEAVDRENPHWAEKESASVSCGPFRLEKWKHNDELQVVKNESYWDAGSVKLLKIVMYMVKEDTELKMFEKKELEWVGSPLSHIPVDALKNFGREQGLKSKAMLGTYFFRVNTEKAALNNGNIRKALAIAIDRQSIVDHILQGDQKPATGLVPASMGLQSNPYFLDHDTEEARRLFQKGLTEIGMTVDSFPSITLIFPTAEKSSLIAQAVQQQWAETLGITLHIQSLERKVYFDILSKQNYDIAVGSWVADFNDPINFLEVFKFKTSGTNNTSWANSEYTRLLDESAALSDPEERRAILAQSEDLLMKEMPIIPIFYYNMLFANQSYVKEMVLSSMGNLDFKWAHLENAN
jgi:oligopeptide transport system substrate-binding protein